VKVRRNEGIAIHIDPKPCVGIREDAGEASAGESTGQPLSRESDLTQGADAVSFAEGNMAGHVSASVRSTLRDLRPWHVQKLLIGNREISSSITRMTGWSASGRRGAVADDARAGEVRPLYSSDEAGEQVRRIGSRWSEGRGLRGTRARTACTGHSAG
jgi:hypothetical protein